jgi:hypothetical protein
MSYKQTHTLTHASTHTHTHAHSVTLSSFWAQYLYHIETLHPLGYLVTAFVIGDMIIEMAHWRTRVCLCVCVCVYTHTHYTCRIHKQNQSYEVLIDIFSVRSNRHHVCTISVQYLIRRTGYSCCIQFE